MRYSLSVGRDEVVLLITQIDVSRFEWREDLFDQVQSPVRSSVLNQTLKGRQFNRFLFSDAFIPSPKVVLPVR